MRGSFHCEYFLFWQYCCFYVLYKPPDPIQSHSKSINQENKLSKEEWNRTVLAALSWTLYNAGYLVFLSFAFMALLEIGVPPFNAAAALSFCSFLIMLSIPFGGFMAEKFHCMQLSFFYQFYCDYIAATSIFRHLLDNINFLIWSIWHVRWWNNYSPCW